MAKYETRWGSDTIGAAPANWSGKGAGWAGVTVQQDAAGERYMDLPVDASAGRRLWTWDSIPAEPDSEIYVEYESQDTASGNDIRLATLVRGSGAAGTENAAMGEQTTLGWRVTQVANGTFSELGIVTKAAHDARLIRVATRLRVNGTTIQFRSWPAHEEEPVGWSTATITAITAGGWVGFYDATKGSWKHVYAVGVGTLGDTAPIPAKPASAAGWYFAGPNHRTWTAFPAPVV